ncbi:hypothetical protein AXF13_07950 [Desulfovibrio fairfieldensis]|uniref:Uncharacterized protein n=1 Tax=Desulfovibrio fairfieldensis TaxID=44742 RepID=A0A0X8JJW9_9BACT|nr:hypothetical protein AXF13_07950 [Desulfovibrio fairfieldensis]
MRKDNIHLGQFAGEVSPLKNFFRKPVASLLPIRTIYGLPSPREKNRSPVRQFHGGSAGMINHMRRQFDGLKAPPGSCGAKRRMILMIAVQKVQLGRRKYRGREYVMR